MVAINAALQVDLTGQVCADSIGPVFYSGVGGQLDFIRGAARSKRGLANHRLALDGQERHHQPHLADADRRLRRHDHRNDVHYIVTEYGVAELYGKTIRQRAQALMDLAHPKFRDELAFAARKIGYL